MDKVKFFSKKFILNPRIKAIFHFFFIGYFFFSLLVLFSPIANWLAILFFVEPKLQKTDAIIVLSASSYPDGTLTLFTLGREIEGISLYKEGWAKKIIFVGNSGDGKTPDAFKMKELAIKLGVPERDILIGSNSFNTYYNLLETQEIMKRENLNNALLVTSSTHTRRSLLVAKKLGLEIYPASFSVDKYRQVSADRLVLFWSEIREIIAIVYYKFKGWI